MKTIKTLTLISLLSTAAIHAMNPGFNPLEHMGDGFRKHLIEHCCSGPDTDQNLDTYLNLMATNKKLHTYLADQNVIDSTIGKAMKHLSHDEKNKLLVDAVEKEKNSAKVRLLVQLGTDINHKWGQINDTALHRAVKNNNKKAVQLLLDSGAAITSKNNYDYTILHCAAQHGKAGLLELLLKNGAGTHINAANIRGETPLHCVRWGTVELGCVKLLVDNGADINFQNNNKCTPLHYASSGLSFLAKFYKSKVDQYLKKLKYFLEEGATVNIKDDKGKTPLDRAKEKGCTPIIKLLTDYAKKNNPNKPKNSSVAGHHYTMPQIMAT